MNTQQRDAQPRPFNCADQATPTWLQRAEVCAELLQDIAPAHGLELSLADVGCGDQKLRDALQERSMRFSYTGYDLLPQSPETRRFDVRSESLPPGHDVVVMLGVIEYLSDLANALQRLSRCVPHLVLSHVIRQGDTYSPDRLRELGWINHLSARELEDLLADCSYAVEARRTAPDGRTMLFRCMSLYRSKP